MTDIELANLKKDIFTAVISNGSIDQKQRALETSKEVLSWCVEGMDKQASSSPSQKRKEKYR